MEADIQNRIAHIVALSIPHTLTSIEDLGRELLAKRHLFLIDRIEWFKCRILLLMRNASELRNDLNLKTPEAEELFSLASEYYHDTYNNHGFIRKGFLREPHEYETDAMLLQELHTELQLLEIMWLPDESPTPTNRIYRYL